MIISTSISTMEHFKEELNDHMMHTSQFTMGVDVADINNDAFPEIITMDMLPSDPYILKRSEGEDNYEIFTPKSGMDIITSIPETICS